jgi:uncharacterized membrane protein YphA (DoxX/SURF4 family)
MNNGKVISILLRIGIAITFLYAALATTLHPNDWIWFFPTFLRNSIPHPLLLTGFSIYEVILGVWLIVGWRTIYAAALAGITILGIIFANLSTMDIVSRDFAIFFAAVALVVGSYQPSKKKK